ncbi:MAG: DinB family protein [Meiothermus sp.]|uniref:DinB family protein n=1 Tax=Meiothermus sp. TaxID=1955249 RepID=UPI0025FE9702|nr:DinB family protein [Meiothermus sp.]MCS7068365.1 DinB family protein [Meiothermus sp.]MDW8426796.1 DinB family protein [Meiothermus sp.]
MNIPEMYDYLVRARRELWGVLEALPDEVLSRPLLNGERFHCIKDLVFHIPSVEDAWLHEDIERNPPVWMNVPALKDTTGGPEYAGFPLPTLLDYWKAVEASTLAYLAALTETELKRVISPHDDPEQHYRVEGLLWHVMLHEVRHTAQIAVLLRTQGIKPPALDLLWFLPSGLL